MTESKDSWEPSQYHRFQNERSQPFFDLLDLVQPFAFSKVVDLGCGTGELTKILHQKTQSPFTLGIDSSASMLEAAAAHAGGGLRFLQGNLADNLLPDTYDLVFSNAAVQWCDDHRELFSKLISSLKPGGQLAVQMPANHDYPTHVIAHQIAESATFKTLLGGGRQSPVQAPEVYAEWLYRLGMQNQKVFVRVYTHQLEDREAVIQWVRGTLLTYYQSRLSAPDFDRFLVEFRRQLFTVLPDERPFFYPFKRLFVWGQK